MSDPHWVSQDSTACVTARAQDAHCDCQLWCSLLAAVVLSLEAALFCKGGVEALCILLLQQAGHVFLVGGGFGHIHRLLGRVWRGQAHASQFSRPGLRKQCCGSRMCSVSALACSGSVAAQLTRVWPACCSVGSNR